MVRFAIALAAAVLGGVLAALPLVHLCRGGACGLIRAPLDRAARALFMEPPA